MNEFVRPNGPEIIRRRRALGWSQEALVAKVGCSRRTIQRVEKGFQAKLETVSEIAQALDCSSEELVIRVSGFASDSRPRRARALLLPYRPSLCVGRESTINDLTVRLNDRDGRQPLVVHGWPGVGKTTLAAVGVHDPQLTAPFDDGVLWASLGETPDVHGVLASWCLAIDCAVPGPGETAADASARLRAALRGMRVLLVIDDVWKPEHAGHLLVADETGAALVTTRLPNVAQALTISNMQVIKLDVLTDEDGLRILEAFVPDLVVARRGPCLELVRTLEGLPLALQVAGRLLRFEAGHTWGVVDLLDELRDSSASLLSHEAPADVTSLASSASQTVAALLNRSIRGLELQVRERYACLGAFAPKPATFQLDALRDVWGVSIQEAKDTVRVLTGRGLLDPVGNEYQMHALLAAHASGLLGK